MQMQTLLTDYRNSLIHSFQVFGDKFIAISEICTDNGAFNLSASCLHSEVLKCRAHHDRLYVALDGRTRASRTLSKLSHILGTLVSSQNHVTPAVERSSPSHTACLPGSVRTLHIPVGKARSTRFGFRIFRTLLLKGTDHSLPLHFHTLFSDKQQ